MGTLKQSLVFVVGLLAAWGIYHFNTNVTNLSLLPYNTIINQLSAVQLQKEKEFAYFLLALQWPNTFCKQQDPKKPCDPNPPIHQNFTIHGLWPQSDDGKSLVNCSTTKPMTRKILGPFWSDLRQYWPNLFSANSFNGSIWFWQHEWNIHGSCSEEKFPPKQYLKITIDLAKKYSAPILLKMEQNGINPDTANKSDLSALRKAVKNATGVVAKFSFANNSAALLREVRLCVQKDGILLFNCKLKDVASAEL